MSTGTAFRVTCAAGLSALVLIGAGCSSGGGSSSGGTASGQFLDSAVENLDWKAGSFTGTTDLDGSIEFPLTESVVFFIDKIVFPSAPTDRFVTPVEMVGSATDETDPAVIQISRFLLSLEYDDTGDSDASNGIQIPDIIYDRAAVLKPNLPLPILWADSDEVDDVLFELLALVDENELLNLPSNTEARVHLRQTLLCLIAGEYSGTYSSDSEGDSGTWSLTVGLGGFATGDVVSDQFGTVPVTGMIDSDQLGMFSDADFSFDGFFSRQGDDASGDWSNSFSVDSGTFSGARDTDENCTP